MRLFNVRTGALVEYPSTVSLPGQLTVDEPRGRLYASGALGGSIALFDLTSGETLSIPLLPVGVSVLSGDGSHLIAVHGTQLAVLDTQTLVVTKLDAAQEATGVYLQGDTRVKEY